MKKQKFDLKYLFLLIPITLILIIGLIYLFNKNKIDNEINWMTMKLIGWQWRKNSGSMSR